MVLLRLKLAVVLLVFTFALAYGKTDFYICEPQHLRVTEMFRATRLAATVFPCFASELLLKYNLPSSIFLASYKPLCFIARTCFAMIPNGRISKRQDSEVVARCCADTIRTLTNMGVFEYYRVPADVRRVFGTGEFMHKFYSESFACYEKNGIENFRIGPDTWIAMIRWLIEKMF